MYLGKDKNKLTIDDFIKISRQTKELSIKNKEFTIIGVKNINTENIVWNNNTPIKSEESEQ